MSNTVLASNDKDLIGKFFTALDLTEIDKAVITGGICTAIHAHGEKFNSFSVKERIAAISLLALVFDILLDREISPEARELFITAFYYFRDGGCNV